MLDSSPKSILAEAIRYATVKGWNVFPAEPGKKKSYKAARFSNGRAWGQTKDEDEIRRDWASWTNANVGLPTGSHQGFFVIDVDTKEGHDRDGVTSLQQLEAQHGRLPATLMARTPSGGLHYYYKHPGDKIKIKTDDSPFAPGIDVRGDGGMVLGPPSIKGENRYEWINDLEPANAPQWLLDLVIEKERPRIDVKEPDRSTPPSLAKIAYAMDIIPNEKDIIWKFKNKAGEVKELSDWSGWNTIMMALWRATNGSDDGCQIARRFSRKNPHKFEKRITTDERWEEITACPPTNLTVGTLFALANYYKPGWQEDFEREQAQRHTVELVRASDIVPRAKQWLWRGHMLLGALELTTGMKGLGKSQTHCSRVACITTGKRWPNGDPGIVPGNRHHADGRGLIGSRDGSKTDRRRG
jgi:hypothetical protein